MSIAKNVKKRAKCLGLTNAEIAKHLRIREFDLCQWFCGRKSLPLKTVWNLLDFLNVSKDELLEII